MVLLLSGGIPVTVEAKLCNCLGIAQTIEAVVQRPLIWAAGGHGEIDQVIALDRIAAAIRKNEFHAVINDLLRTRDIIAECQADGRNLCCDPIAGQFAGWDFFLRRNGQLCCRPIGRIDAILVSHDYKR